STYPEGVVNRVAITGCVGSSCTLGPTTSPTGPGNSIECTNTGCIFGAPVPSPNNALSTCTINTFTAPVSGALDISTGTTSNLSIPLAAHTYLTKSQTNPCPLCITGTPGGPFAPQVGTCDFGARKGLSCLTTSPQGLSKDCPPLNGETLPNAA